MITRVASRATPGFWLLAIVLVVYVAACARFRDNNLEADAWEHLSVLHALTENPWNPGNPTYDLDIPSVRYSPYFVGLAFVCRLTHIDPYSALTAAAVLNTCLLILGIWLFLSSFDEAASAAAALFVVVTLYGSPPGYANSLALSDLPLLAVNPSAFSLPLVLISWSIFRRIVIRGRGAVEFVAISLLLACAVLDHAMTGVFGLMGLFVLAFAGDRQARWNMTLVAASIAAVAIGLALIWPWFSFFAALRSNRDRDYWFNPYILELMLTSWCAPAALCALFLIPLRDRPLIRTCLIGGTLSIVVGLLALVIKSPAFARFPLAGIIYFQLALGVFVHDSELLRPSRWPKLLRQLVSPDSSIEYRAIVQVTVAIFLVYFLIPQLVLIAKEPSLGRKYLAKITGRREKIEYPRQAMGELLAPIGPRDVVLSDIQTSWRIPSTRGRVLAALHYELFVPDQPQRTIDLNNFFSSDNEAERDAVIRKYGVAWIVLNRNRLGDAEFASLLRKPAVVGSSDDGNLVLMRADSWMKAGAQ
ncbi:MAG: hypothetical protein ABSD30_09890 [Candidatus Binatus sp.]